MKVPEQYRVKIGNMPSNLSDGNNGFFEIQFEEKIKANVICSDGFGWEHVSVVIIDNEKHRLATWDEMCKIKDLFWEDEVTVIQYHPKKSEYVNNHEFVLHLWKPIGAEIPLPPTILVGIK